MQREEFDYECKKICDVYEPSSVTSDMYSEIEFVYTWYPTISEVRGKEQIAYLYITFGFSIIRDMHRRAVEVQKLDKRISVARRELDKLEGMRAELASGSMISSRDLITSLRA